MLLCHHNLYYSPSPYHLSGDLFSVPSGKSLFAKIQLDGSLLPIFGNFLCERVDIPTDFILPEEERTQYLDRIIVTDPGYTRFKKGQLLFTRLYSYYEIVFTINSIEHRVHKCHEENVCAIA